MRAKDSDEFYKFLRILVLYAVVIFLFWSIVYETKLGDFLNSHWAIEGAVGAVILGIIGTLYHLIFTRHGEEN
jgi:hypothetical protein